ncbi:multidrug MFS transporter [Priestia veravalensis]|uniref:Multidrug MFS transporter n=1 Tax=Priestia veravalensis TaxID=1414648 RepID=A0A0V8JJ30_9BACI|nr:MULTISPECIES: sugar transferase [Priestia]KSU87030.1 multidrug MFS transporter [Priestia veravalensis]SCC44037.1 Sugar transferase involved in LPS biosynthesis (colanic, teichoic acid) [Priestia flexa]
MAEPASKKVETVQINQATFQKQQSFLYYFVKRGIDILGASAGLLLTLPVFLLISLLYLYGDNKGPVFFGQTRVGKGGNTFKMYKFRSMIVNAEQVLKNDRALYQKYLQNNYKLEPHEDPRITKVGQFLRKTSLDELPQLINVLKGDMSLVGPRPVIVEELKEYSHRLDEFLTVKPGVTGYWQICGRSDVGYPERADLEFYYIDHQGFKLDFKIIINTILMVVTGKGAY